MTLHAWLRGVVKGHSSKRARVSQEPGAAESLQASSCGRLDGAPAPACLSVSCIESIQELPDELLERVLYKALKEGYCTRDGLAVVCKRWSDVISHSSLFWNSTCLSLSDIKVCLALAYPKRRQSGLRRRVMQWLRERSGLVRSLHLLECCRMEADLPAMLAAAAAPTLTTLRLEACSGNTDKILRAVGGMRGLRSLEIDHARRLGLGEPLGRYNARLLCVLGRLEHLVLHVPRLEGGLGCITLALTALKTLHVCTEEDYEFRLDHITNLTALREVTVTGAMLSPLPLSASRLTNLSTLNLSETRCLAGTGGEQERQDNGGPLFWDTLDRLPVLRTLSSRHCDMHGSNLSRGVLTVTSLRSLELCSYLLNLPELPPGALPELSCLVFEGCHLLHFPLSWCSLPALHTLKFKSAPPDSLPPEISRLASLRELSLEGGLARCLVPCCALTALTRLRLAHMDFLATLPGGPYLAGLRKLDLQGNRFLALPPALSSCMALEELDLSNNSRLQLGPTDVQDVLCRLPALRTLHLHKDSALCELGGSPWDLRSVQALMALAAAKPGLKVCLDAACQRVSPALAEPV